MTRFTRAALAPKFHLSTDSSERIHACFRFRAGAAGAS